MSFPRSPDALDVIAKMFLEPMPPHPSPNLMESEIIRTEESSMDYIPAMWADPLVPYHLECGGVGHSFDDMPAVDLCVNNGLGRTETPRLCELSAKGQQIRTFVKQYNSDFLKIHEEMDPDLLLDLITKACILVAANDIVVLDEAAFLRLLMLQTMTVDPVQLVETSSAVNEMALNMYVKPQDIQSCWSPALESSNGLQIGTELETCTLYFRTLDEYTHDHLHLKTKDGQEVDHSCVIFVPVKMEWQNQTWLMPYILAFTTTTWWNHAYTIDVTYSNSVESKIEDKLMKQRFMPRSSMVCIGGVYERICLIVVDARSETFPPNADFRVCQGISATRLGSFEFAKHVHSYLNRTVDPENPTSHITESDCVLALHRMKELYCTPNQFRLLHLKASILATSRFNGFGVSPKPEAVPGGHIFGPVQFNSQTLMKIGDYILPDLLDETAKIRSQRLYCHQMWRCDPLGYFTHDSVSLLKDHAQNPCLHKIKTNCFRYTASTSPSNQRILRACGLIENEPLANYQMLFETHPIRTTLRYGSLMLGLTNWAFVELGCTMFEHNGLGKIHFHSLWSSLTRGFVLESFPYKCSQRFLKTCGWIMNYASKKKDVDSRWFDCHYSWNVPWWYVASIAYKLGCTFELQKRINYDEYTNDWLVFPCLDDSTGQNKHPYDLSITASSQYERDVNRGMPAFFEILTPTSEGLNVKHNLLSWNPNNALDKKKEYFRSTHCPHREAGAVELNVVVFPSARIGNLGRAIVSESNRVHPHNDHTYPHITCRSWPNINLTWYRDGQKVVKRPSINVIQHYIEIKEDDEDTEEEQDINELSIGLENQNINEEVTELASEHPVSFKQG